MSDVTNLQLLNLLGYSDRRTGLMGLTFETHKISMFQKADVLRVL